MNDPLGEIYFDATCGLCSQSYRLFGRMTEARGFVWVPLQDSRVQELLGLKEGALPEELKLRKSDGLILGGVDALLFIARRIWWAWPVFALSRLPGMRWVLKHAYRLLARHRYRFSRACRLKPMR